MKAKEYKRCKSKRVVKAGFKKLVDGKVQRYKCQECGHYFTNQEKYHHLSKEKIDMINRLYRDKESKER